MSVVDHKLRAIANKLIANVRKSVTIVTATAFPLFGLSKESEMSGSGRLGGFIRAICEEFDSDSDFKILECILTRDKLAVDWIEDGIKLHAKLGSADGKCYYGTYGTPELDDAMQMTGVRQKFNGKDVFLVTWTNDYTGECGIFNLLLESVSIVGEDAESANLTCPQSSELPVICQLLRLKAK